MRSLSSTLLAAQRSAGAVPYLRVQLADVDLGVPKLRWERWYSGIEADGPSAAAVPADNSLLRARIDPATDALSHSRVASPGPSSTYSSWTSLGAVVVAPRLGLSAMGTRALLASIRTDGVSVEVRESTDSGATFGASTLVATAGGPVTAVACALRTTGGSAAVFFAVAGVVYACTRTGVGAWSAPAAWTNTLVTVDAIAATTSTDYELLVGGVDAAGDAAAWATRLGAGGSAPPGTWLSLTPVAIASAGTGVTYLASALANLDVARATLVESYSGGGAYSRAQLASVVGGTSYGQFLWREPRPFEHASAHGLGMAGGASDAWLVAPDAVWHAPLGSALTDLTADVLDATLEQSAEGGRLRLVLRNDDGRYNAGVAPLALEARGELSVSPGYLSTAGPEWSAGPRFWISTVARRRVGGASTVELEALDAWGVLRAWSAPRQLVWAPNVHTAEQVIEELLVRAGLSLASATSGEATQLKPGLTVRAGEDGARALRRLLDALPEDLRPSFGSLQLYEPKPADATAYAYGGDHALLTARIEAGPARAGWSRVFGAAVFAEAFDDGALRDGAAVVIAVDDNLTAQPRADARAATLLRRSALAARRGEIVVPVNAGQEIGDVIAITDPTLGLSAERFRVSALQLRYVRGGARPRYDLTLALSEV